jgi:hypothetical protein
MTYSKAKLNDNAKKKAMTTMITMMMIKKKKKCIFHRCLKSYLTASCYTIKQSLGNHDFSNLGCQVGLPVVFHFAENGVLVLM